MAKQKSLQPNTTEQQDLTFAGQRRVNLIWEYTQAFVAIIVVLSCMIVGAYNGITGKGEFPQVLSNAAFLIVGFYFSRTNHQAIGGIGKKPDAQDYEGR